MLGDRERAHREATALYMARRGEADDGCEVSWNERYTRPHEVSAIQHAYDVLIDDGPEVFASEYQNEPLDERAASMRRTAAWVASKTNNLSRGVVPKEAEHVTAYIDVHMRLLYYVAVAWKGDFTGSVIDYGTYPRQPISYYAQQTAPVPMESQLPDSNEDAWIKHGIKTLTDAILSMRLRREDSAEVRIGMTLIDARWGEKSELVKEFVRRHADSGTRLMAAMGMGIGPAQKTFAEYNPEPGTRTGLAWRIAPPKQGCDRWVSIDTNWWKSLVAGRLALPSGTAGGIDLFGVDPREHALFADHCVSEAPVETTAKGRTRDVWEWLLPHSDNHYWDCLVGCAVGASMLGCRIAEFQDKKQPKRVLSMKELAARAKHGR
jgi:hypothetical protein